MNKIIFVCFVLVMQLNSAAQDLNYYLPEDVTYNAAIPKTNENNFIHSI